VALEYSRRLAQYSDGWKLLCQVFHLEAHVNIYSFIYQQLIGVSVVIMQ